MGDSNVSSTTPLIGVKKDDFASDWTKQSLSAVDIESLGIGDVNKDKKFDLDDFLASADTNKDETIDLNELSVFYGKLDWSNMTEPAKAATFAVQQWTKQQSQESLTAAQTDAKNSDDKTKLEALTKAQDAQQTMLYSQNTLNEKYTDAANAGMQKYNQQVADAANNANIANKLSPNK